MSVDESLWRMLYSLVICLYHLHSAHIIFADMTHMEVLPSDRILTWIAENKSAHNYLQSNLLAERSIRYTVGLFPSTMTIMERNVTCDNAQINLNEPEYYTEPTWACDNLQIDGRRLPYAYVGGLARVCGTYFPENNMLALCEQLMELRGIPNAKTYYAMVTNASCDATSQGILFISDPRFGTYWSEYAAFLGYTISIRCGLLMEFS